MNLHSRITPDHETLVRLFYDSPDELAHFELIDRADALPVYRALLHHEHHMTVTVENFHGCPVNVRVLETRRNNDHYARKILLTRQSDGEVVQFGIMRLNLAVVSDDVRREIESQQIPLGRLLIAHNVLRKITLMQLYRIRPGADLCRLFEMGPKEITYGRTASIDFDDEPAVELLEIVTPVRE